jgi:hypothetical protein
MPKEEATRSGVGVLRQRHMPTLNGKRSEDIKEEKKSRVLTSTIYAHGKSERNCQIVTGAYEAMTSMSGATLHCHNFFSENCCKQQKSPACTGGASSFEHAMLDVV